MSMLGFYFEIIRALEEIGVSYMLVGAFAGSAFGITRATFDVDMLVDLRELHFDALAQRFPPPRYYTDPEQMRNSTRLGIMFNIIDTSQGIKSVRAARLGTEVLELWQVLLNRAEAEIREGPPTGCAGPHHG